MLHGIGGRTIEEAKENLTHMEVQQWAAYIRKRGSLNIGRRLEWGFAIIAQLLNNAHFKEKRSNRDFMPHEHEEAPIALDQAMREWD